MSERTCRGCGALLPARPPGRRGASPVYCSDQCRQRTLRARSERERAGMGVRRGLELECGFCGVRYVARHEPRRETPYCSRSCAARARGTLPPAICEVCGEPYQRTYNLQRTCGRDCGRVLSARHPNNRHRKPREPKEPTTFPSSRIYSYTCLTCGALFTARTKRKTPTCSDRCAHRWQNAHRPGARRLPWLGYCTECGIEVEMTPRPTKCSECRAETVRAQRRRRRARERRAVSEPYDLAELIVRDEGCCRLCGCSVAVTEVVPHLLAPTVDHIRPLAHGGDDTRANVQLAHFLCNSLKADHPSLSQKSRTRAVRAALNYAAEQARRGAPATTRILGRDRSMTTRA